MPLDRASQALVLKVDGSETYWLPYPLWYHLSF